MDNATQKVEQISYKFLSEPQLKVLHSLASFGLKEKVENFLTVEIEKHAREEYVSGYPFWLTIDPANLCNLRCPFCPTGQERGSRTKGVLSLDDFKRVMNELGPYLIHIDFCNWGEPLLNKDIYRMIKYAKEYNIDTKIDSNLNHFSEQDAEAMILSGLDKLIMSIDGTAQETYSKYRIGGDFNKVMENLKILLAKRKELKRSNPYIAWQFLVFRHNEHEIDKAKEMGRDLGVDTVDITKAFIGREDWIPLNEEYSNYRKEKIEKQYTSDYFKPPKDKFCNWPWEAIVVNCNGSISPCCSVEDEKDDFGTLGEGPVKEVWNNGKFRQARRYIKDDRVFEKNGENICIGCRHSGLINLDIRSIHSFYR